MNRHAWLLVSGCVWAVMMFLLFEREIKPYFEYQQAPSYRTMLARKRETEFEKRAIYFATQRIGEVESLTEPLSAGGYRLKKRLQMQMKPFMRGLPLPDDQVILASDSRVDAAYQLADLRIDAKIAGMPLHVKAERQGDRLRVLYDVLNGVLKADKLVEFPRDATLSDNFIPFQGGGGLREGKKWKMKFMDVNNLVFAKKKEEASFTEMYATVVAREAVTVGEKDVPAFKVEVREQPNDEPEKWAYQIWVDDQGVVVKQLMKIERLPCEILLEERRILTVEEGRAVPWSIPSPR